MVKQVTKIPEKIMTKPLPAILEEFESGIQELRDLVAQGKEAAEMAKGASQEAQEAALKAAEDVLAKIDSKLRPMIEAINAAQAAANQAIDQNKKLANRVSDLESEQDNIMDMLGRLENGIKELFYATNKMMVVANSTFIEEFAWIKPKK